MNTTSISTFNHTLEQSHQWLKELKELGNLESEEVAYSIFRAVLHSLRDRLLPNQAVHLASEMPLLIKGVYYDGWKPATNPTKERTKDEFIASVKHNLLNMVNRVDPSASIKLILNFLTKKISAGEIKDVKAEFPRELLDLWQEEA